MGELDNRGSHFYLAMFWAEALAAQTKDTVLQQRFAVLAATLSSNEAQILTELNAVQGKPVAIGGYFQPSPELLAAAMRPSTTFNQAIASL